MIDKKKKRDKPSPEERALHEYRKQKRILEDHINNEWWKLEVNDLFNTGRRDDDQE